MFEELRKPGGKLKLAVPRGALLDDVLGLLDEVGIDTAEARGDSRSLVFDGGETTLVTMRPSDVPTYVSAGAADLGITGKDVLLEQNDRPVFYMFYNSGTGNAELWWDLDQDSNGFADAELVAVFDNITGGSSALGNIDLDQFTIL